jgi:protein TonB
MNRIQVVLFGGSLVAHLGVWAWMGVLPKDKKTSSVAIALAESRKKEEAAKPKPPEPPPPPPMKAEPTRPKAPAPAPEPKAPEPLPPVNPPPPSAGDAPTAMDGFADLGLGAMTGGGGMAVPTGPKIGAAPRAAEPVTRKAKALVPTADDACTEDPVKPKLENQVQPAYTAEGRQASVEGLVKLEITIDATGHVTSVRVLRGLGFGLDEAAVAAAKQWTFKPATRCGKPVPFTVKPGVRFQLGS